VNPKSRLAVTTILAIAFLAVAALVVAAGQNPGDHTRLLLPESEARNMTNQQIAQELMQRYLRGYQRAGLSDRLVSFQIDEVHVPESAAEEELRFSVTYDVRPLFPVSDWDAGNGLPGEDGWIRRKFAFVSASHQNDGYRITSLATGL
jgi:hypothetical protein